MKKHMWLRRSARILGAAVSGSWLFILIASAFSERGPLTWESFAVIAFSVTAVLLFLVSWRWEKVGGALLVLLGIAFNIFGYFSAGQNQWIAVLASGVPFLIVGLLFLAGGILSSSD